MTTRNENMKHVIVIGAGGNIGSHLLPHLARMKQVSNLTLIDPDSYDATNLNTQNITVSDVGKRKVFAQARKLKRINPTLEITTIALPVDAVPLGVFRSACLLACLDSRRARMQVNRVAVRLGIPWIDAGVEPGGWLARVNVYANALDGPCLECAWDKEDYRLLEQRYACAAERNPSSFPSNSPSGLGALAASLQALAVQKLLDAAAGPALRDTQVLIDARNQRHFITTFSRSPNCVNEPHRPWRIEVVSGAARDLTLADIFKVGRKRKGRSPSCGGARSLSMPDHRFGVRLYCPGCGHCQDRLRLLRANSARDLRCPNCSREMWAVGRDTRAELVPSELSYSDLKRSLYSLGLRDSDVFTIAEGTIKRHFGIALQS